MTIAIILAIAEIIGLFAIGIAARLLGYINENDIDRSSRLVIDFLLPAFTFTAIITGLDVSRFHELRILPIIGFLQVLYFTIAGTLLRFGLLRSNRNKQRTFIHLCAVNNSTLLPVIILRNIWGDASLANLFLLYLGGAVGVWTLGVGVLEASSIKQSIKGAFRPNLAAIFIAIAVALTGGSAYIPVVIMKILTTAGSVAVPLMLIMSGASLANRKTLKVTWPIVYITIVRLLLLPLLTVPLLALLPIPEDVYSVAVIVALMPTAISSVIVTRRYGGQPGYAASAALATTVCSIVTVPAAVWFLFGR
ncbi:MAG: AEC family transporter [Chitinispirillaceae bacterium]|nr:AEC family transporter [Chitinispirillaceae bacterium]